MSTAATAPDDVAPSEIRLATMPGGRLARLKGWMQDPIGYIERGRSLGDVVVSEVGGQQMWQLYLPRLIERVLVTNASNYNKATKGYRAMRVALGQGLVTSEGDLWKRQRRIANPAFRRKTIAAMADTMSECAVDLADDWATSAGGPSRDIAQDMTELTLRIACRTFFSVDVNGPEAHAIGDATAAVVKQFIFHMAFPVSRPELLPTPGNLRYWRALRTLDETVYGLVAARRASSERPHDLLSLFLEAVDDEDGTSMSDEQLRDELVTMMAAGHETTANGLAFTLMLLAQNPDQAARLQAELDEVLGGRPPTGADLRNLPFLDRVFAEGIRLYPPAWVHARCAVEDDFVEGLTIPKGSFTMLPQWAVHRDPRWWDAPERFDPDRFLPERSEGRPKFAYFPFSGGQRKCIGDHFAKMEAALILGTLVQRFDLRMDESHAVELDPGVTLRPKHGIKLFLTERRSAG